MGWSIGYGSRAEMIRSLTQDETSANGTTRRCLKKVTKGNILWTVWEITPLAAEPHRYIGCDKMQRFEGKEWGYKDLYEGSGYSTCPLSFFRDVPEPPNQDAREWRAQIRALHAKRQGIKVLGWVKLKDNIRPLFVECKSIKPLKFYGYRKIMRSQIDRPVPELDALLEKLNAEAIEWTNQNPSPDARQALILFAKRNPWPLRRSDLETISQSSIGFSSVLVDVWNGKTGHVDVDTFLAAPWKYMPEEAAA